MPVSSRTRRAWFSVSVLNAVLLAVWFVAQNLVPERVWPFALLSFLPAQIFLFPPLLLFAFARLRKQKQIAAFNLLVLTLAFDYSGRQELLTAIRHIVADGIPPDEIDDATIARYLYTTHLPDPDLIIRTSGEYRLSNFLVWQSAYSELYFSPVLWPEFGPEDLEDAVRDFSRRERRFGNISAEAARMKRESA